MWKWLFMSAQKTESYVTIWGKTKKKILSNNPRRVLTSLKMGHERVNGSERTSLKSNVVPFVPSMTSYLEEMSWHFASVQLPRTVKTEKSHKLITKEIPLAAINYNRLQFPPIHCRLISNFFLTHASKKNGFASSHKSSTKSPTHFHPLPPH